MIIKVSGENIREELLKNLPIQQQHPHLDDIIKVVELLHPGIDLKIFRVNFLDSDACKPMITPLPEINQPVLLQFGPSFHNRSESDVSVAVAVHEFLSLKHLDKVTDLMKELSKKRDELNSRDLGDEEYNREFDKFQNEYERKGVLADKCRRKMFVDADAFQFYLDNNLDPEDYKKFLEIDRDLYLKFIESEEANKAWEIAWNWRIKFISDCISQSKSLDVEDYIDLMKSELKEHYMRGLKET